MNELVIESSGNVFSDLGFDPGEAAILQMRANRSFFVKTAITVNTG